MYERDHPKAELNSEGTKQVVKKNLALWWQQWDDFREQEEEDLRKRWMFSWLPAPPQRCPANNRSSPPFSCYPFLPALSHPPHTHLCFWFICNSHCILVLDKFFESFRQPLQYSPQFFRENNWELQRAEAVKYSNISFQTLSLCRTKKESIYWRKHFICLVLRVNISDGTSVRVKKNKIFENRKIRIVTLERNIARLWKEYDIIMSWCVDIWKRYLWKIYHDADMDIRAGNEAWQVEEGVDTIQ